MEKFYNNIRVTAESENVVIMMLLLKIKNIFVLKVIIINFQLIIIGS